MKIRIYSPFFPFPVTEGSFQVISDQIRTLAEMGHAVEVILIRETSLTLKQKIDQLDPNILALPIQWRVLSEPLNTNTSNQLQRAFRVARSFFSDLASPELYYYPSELSGRSHLAQSGKVDLAIYHYSFAYSWLRKKACLDESKQVVFFHNLESELSLLRAKGTQNRLLSWIHQKNFRKLSSHEGSLAELCDEIWFISPTDEKSYFKQHTVSNKALFRLTPPTYSESLHKIRKTGFETNQSQFDRQARFGIIGDLGFGPNHDSVQWIIEKLAPLLLQRKFDGKILIGGKNARPELREMAKSFPFIEFLGFVRDIETFWNQLSFMLVPHISGSGVRIKLLEAIASSVPVLANGDAIERTHPEIQCSPFLKRCDTAEDWIEFMLQEKPFQTRKNLSAQTMPTRLRGTEVYAFLNPQSASPNRTSRSPGISVT